MAMVSIKGVLTEDGKIKVELPDGWQAGEIRVEVQIEPAWSDEEIDEMLNFKGKPLGAIDPSLIGAGADWDIGDSAEWVREQRNKRRRKWTE
ncbi:MAG: hypothetical protein Phog2KO_24590 [Phototrophicaceae bacterium]